MSTVCEVSSVTSSDGLEEQWRRPIESAEQFMKTQAIAGLVEVLKSKSWVLSRTAFRTGRLSAGLLPVSDLITDLLTSLQRDESTSLTRIAQAVVVLAEHPDWSNRRVAHDVGCDHAFLANARYQLIRAAIKDVGSRRSWTSASDVVPEPPFSVLNTVGAVDRGRW